MKEAHILKIIIEERALIRMLTIIDEHDQLYTRQLLRMLGQWGHGHKLLEKAEANRLVKRKIVKNKLYNSLTKDGKKIVELAKELGV